MMKTPISFGLPFEPEDSQYGKSRFTLVSPLGEIKASLTVSYARGHPDSCACRRRRWSSRNWSSRGTS